MDFLQLHEGGLWLEQVNLRQLAERYGTPLYVYSRAGLERNWRAFDEALRPQPHLVCYAVKANSNLAVLNVLARLNSGFDIVSEGELRRVLLAGGDPAKVVFSGVGKSVTAIATALSYGILSFNVESAEELTRIHQVAAAHGVAAPISLRVNPDVDAQTHPYIATGLQENKFGVDWESALALYARAAELEHVRIVGIDCHIGSQLTSLAPFQAALDRVLTLADQLAAQGIHLEHLDMGGGLGVRYRAEQPPSVAEYAQTLLAGLQGRPYRLLVEPGRAIVANAGLLLTTVEYLKQHSNGKRFAIVDAGMNDLIRPSLYSAWQTITPVHPRNDTTAHTWDVVGPVCETGDFLGKERELALDSGDVLAVLGAGAYGFAMSSQYNSRPRAAEILVDGDFAHVARQREAFDDLWRNEALLPGQV